MTVYRYVKGSLARQDGQVVFKVSFGREKKLHIVGDWVDGLKDEIRETIKTTGGIVSKSANWFGFMDVIVDDYLENSKIYFSERDSKDLEKSLDKLVCKLICEVRNEMVATA